MGELPCRQCFRIVAPGPPSPTYSVRLPEKGTKRAALLRLSEMRSRGSDRIERNLGIRRGALVHRDFAVAASAVVAAFFDPPWIENGRRGFEGCVHGIVPPSTGDFPRTLKTLGTIPAELLRLGVPPECGP